MHLPWQQGAWPARVRWATLLGLPVLMAVAAARFDPVQAAVVSMVVAALLVITATDMLRFRVPNAITYPGTVAVLAAALLMPDGRIGDAILAALVGGGVFFILAVITAWRYRPGRCKARGADRGCSGTAGGVPGPDLRRYRGGGGHGHHARCGHRQPATGRAVRALPIAGSHRHAAHAGWVIRPALGLVWRVGSPAVA